MRDALTPGEIQTELSNALARLMRDFYGKGAARARTFLLGEYVVTSLEEVLTTAERALRDGGDGDLVSEVRMAFQSLMTQTFVSEVQRLTGRRVVAYHSQIIVEQDHAFEIFVLEPSDADDAAFSAPEGKLRAAISGAMMRVISQTYGKGPARARTFVADGHVFCALQGIRTTVEQTLIDGGQEDLVRRLRTRFHETASASFAEAVAALTGREVTGSTAQVVFEPDVLFLIFLLG